MQMISKRPAPTSTRVEDDKRHDIIQMMRRKKQAKRSTKMTKTKKLSISPTGGRSSCPNSANCLNMSKLLLLFAVSISMAAWRAEPTQAWRLFASRLSAADQSIEPTSGRSFSDHYQPFYNNVYGLAAPNQNQIHNQINPNNNLNNYHQFQTSQLLTPSTGAGQASGLRDHQQANLRVSSYLNEQLIGAPAPEVANNPPQSPSVPQTAPPPAPQAAALSAAPQTSPPAEPATAQAEAQPVKARDASPEPNAKQQQQQQQPPASNSNSESPSPLGKIIDTVLSSALNESLSSRGQSTAGEHQSNATQQQSTGGRILNNVASQILKPRNKSSLQNDSKKGGGAASAEQQIINQHARVHLAGHSHQRLLPTKHRDNKLAAQLSSADSSSATGSPGSSSFIEPLYSLLLNNFKSGISSRSSIKKAISDNKLARTLTSVTKTMGSNKYVAGAGAAAALAALGLTMSKLLTPYLFAGAYSKLGEPMSMSGSSLLNSYMLNTDRNYQPMMSASSSSPSSMFFLPGNQETLMSTSSSTMPRISPTQSNFYQANGDTLSANLQAYLDQQQQQQQFQQQQFSSPSQSVPSMSPSSLSSTTATTGSKQVDLTPASDINGYYTNFYNNAPPEDQLVASSSYPSSIKDIQNQPTNVNNNNINNYNNNDQMIMSAASSINSLGYAASPASFMPRRSGTVSLKMDDTTRNLLHQMINQRQREQPHVLPQVITNYYGQVSSPKEPQHQQDYSANSWTASSLNNEESSAAINSGGQQPASSPVPSLYYYNAPASAEGSLLIERPLQQQQQINQGGQMSSLSSTKQQVEPYSSPTGNANSDKRQWLSPASHQQQPQQRPLRGQTRLESRGWQSIQQQQQQQQQQSQSASKTNKQSAGGDNGLYQLVDSRQNATNANERDQRDVQWQSISRPPKTSSKTSTSSKITGNSIKTGRVYIKHRRPAVVSPVVGEFQVNSSSPVAAQTIDYGLPVPVTGDENRQQAAGVLFDLQPAPPEATSTESSSDNNNNAAAAARLHHLNHLRKQQQQQQQVDVEDDKQNAIKVIEMNGNNQTQQQAAAVPMEAASSTSLANNGDIISSSSALSLGDIVVVDNRPAGQQDNRQDEPLQDHLERDNKSIELAPGRAYRGSVAGSIVSSGVGLAGGHLSAD